MIFFGKIPLKTKFLVLEIFYINFINLMKMTTPTPSDNIHCPKIKLNSDLLWAQQNYEHSLTLWSNNCNLWLYLEEDLIPLSGLAT